MTEFLKKYILIIFTHNIINSEIIIIHILIYNNVNLLNMHKSSIIFNLNINSRRNKFKQIY